MDESYVREILKGMPPNLSLADFMLKCVLDVNAGYRTEVREAARRYFKEGK